MKVLYFDLEHGHQTLGSKEECERIFGLPVLSPSTWDQFQGILSNIYTSKTETVVKKIGSLEIPETHTVVVPKDNVKVDALVLDTFSELSKKFQRSLTDKSGAMKIQGWGQLKNKLDSCLEFISRIPGTIVLTCHSKTQTMDDGSTRIQPYIDGSTKDDISKWFDFVFYTKTIKKNNMRKFVWVTKRDEMYDNAKDRTNLLDDMIDQDFSLVKEAAKRKGFSNTRILIIGSPGSGKTMSLQTLTQEVSKPNVATEEYNKQIEGDK